MKVFMAACSKIPWTSGIACSRASGRPTRSRRLCCSRATRYRLRRRSGPDGAVLCPLDQKVYIDLSFYEQMKRQSTRRRLCAGVRGGTRSRLITCRLCSASRRRARTQEAVLSSAQPTRIQVAWSCKPIASRGLGEPQRSDEECLQKPRDVEEALNAATQIGDDMIQRKMTGRVVPDAFTHGSAKQRVRWFTEGLKSGRMENCDTFNTSDL